MFRAHSSVCRGGGQPRHEWLLLLRSSLVRLTRPVLAAMRVAVLSLQCIVRSTVRCTVRCAVRRAGIAVLQYGWLRANRHWAYSTVAGGCAHFDGPDAGRIPTAARACAAVHADALHPVRAIPPLRVMREKLGPGVRLCARAGLGVFSGDCHVEGAAAGSHRRM